MVLGRQGFTNGPSGSDAGIGIGGRPWLQKVAALTVAISLTIATANTFRIAEKQYEMGFADAFQLQEAVEGGTELKVIRIISDTFLWLAQAQTLIRLFPRQREKIIIKWTAFALITLDVLFTTLNSFVYDDESRPRSIVDAIPALSYLFQLALSLLYCAWVMYYSATKKRFAFYHPQMRNICLVALLSLVSIFVPVVFFVLDMSEPTLAAWGDYVRWVGAAAASVVVWEWVERIEALERNDKKDGVLGREVFDGDEMLDITPSSESTWTRRSKNGKENNGGGSGTTTGIHGLSWPAMSGISSRYIARTTRDIEEGGVQFSGTAGESKKTTTLLRPPLWPTRPPAAATPLSRTDTASAESTIYAIRYHPISEVTPTSGENGRSPGISRSSSIEDTSSQNVNDDSDPPDIAPIIQRLGSGQDPSIAERFHNPWRALTKMHPFKRKVQEPPPEVSAHALRPELSTDSGISSNLWDVRAKIEGFAAAQVENFREKDRGAVNTAPLPVRVIPAPTRRRNIAATLKELQGEDTIERDRSDSAQWESLPSSSQNSSEVFDPLSHPSLPHRSSEPYTPDDLTRHSIIQRDAISFITAVDQDRQRGAEQDSPLDDRRRNSSSLSRSPTSPHSSNGLPVLSIPAPTRRPRSDEE